MEITLKKLEITPNNVIQITDEYFVLVTNQNSWKPLIIYSTVNFVMANKSE